MKIVFIPKIILKCNLLVLKFEFFKCYLSTQASCGKGPDYLLLKTAIFPTSVFLILFSMKFHTELEIISMTVFNKDDSYLSLFIIAHAQNKQFR